MKEETIHVILAMAPEILVYSAVPIMLIGMIIIALVKLGGFCL